MRGRGDVGAEAPELRRSRGRRGRSPPRWARSAPGMGQRVVARHRLGDREPCVRLRGGHGRAIYAERGGDVPVADRSGGVDHSRRREPAFDQRGRDLDQALVAPAARTGAACRRRRPCRCGRTRTGLPSPARPASGSGARTAVAPRALAAPTRRGVAGCRWWRRRPTPGPRRGRRRRRCRHESPAGSTSR